MNGESTLPAPRAVKAEIKLKHAIAPTLLHLKAEVTARDRRLHQEHAIQMHALVCKNQKSLGRNKGYCS